MGLREQEQNVKNFVSRSDATRDTLAEVSLNSQVHRMSASSVLGQLTDK